MICASWIYYVQSATANSWFFNWITTMIYPTLCSFNSVSNIWRPLFFSPTHAIFVRCFIFMALVWCIALQTYMRASWFMSMAIMLVWNRNSIWRFCSIIEFIFNSAKAVKDATIFSWVFVNSSVRWLTVCVRDAIDYLSAIVVFARLEIASMVSYCASVLFLWKTAILAVCVYPTSSWCALPKLNLNCAHVFPHRALVLKVFNCLQIFLF